MDQFNTLIVRAGAELPLPFAFCPSTDIQIRLVPRGDDRLPRLPRPLYLYLYLYLAPTRSPSSRTRPVVMPRRPRARPPGAGTTCGPSGARRAGPRTR